MSGDLKRAEGYLKTSPKKAYEIYKSLYIKSLVDKDVARYKEKILAGLVESSKKTGRSYTKYQKELQRLKKASPKKSSKSSAKLPRLRKIILRRGYVEFEFDRPVSKKSISFWRMHRGGRHKNIYDIKGILATGPKSYKLRSVDGMRVAQYDKETIRIVFEDEKRIYTKKELQGNRLLIHLRPPSSGSKSVKAPPPPPPPKPKRVIVIDPGHGGRDTGAIGYKRKREKDIVLAISRRLYHILKERGYKVHLTRRGDYFVRLRNRTALANKVKANLFISIHANAAPTKSKYLSMKGLETFFLSPSRSERAKRVAAKENMVDMKSMSYFTKQVYLDFLNREKTILSNKLAIDIQRGVLASVRKRYSLVDGGVRPGPFWVLVGAQMPAVLVEVGYITNPTEAKRLSSPYYQKLIAKGIADGIESYFRNNEQ